jgi:GlpG protein
MRKIGDLPSQSQAEQFHHYLAGHGIDNHIDRTASGWEVWVIDEARVQQGREALEDYLADPHAPRFKTVALAAPPSPTPVRVVRRVPVGNGAVPVTVLLTAASVLVTLATNFGKKPDLMNWLMLSPLASPNSLTPILQGEIWRLYTPMFLHFNAIHLAFDVYMFWILAGVIERVRGSRELLFLLLLISPVSHLTQYAIAGGSFGGLSGVVYGLFGYLWMRAKFLPGDGFYMPREVVMQLLVWAFLCLFGVLGPVANGAHFGGLFAGMILGAAPRLWRKY